MKINDKRYFGIFLLILEVLFLASLFSIIPPEVLAEIGDPNATAITNLTVGNSFPEIQNVSLDNDAASIALTPNSTKTISCVAVIVDYNGELDIDAVDTTFYHTSTSAHESPDDNNDHYTNSSCSITLDTGGFNGFADDEYNVLSNCTYEVEYYANPNEWNCNVTANDTSGGVGTNFDLANISELLSIDLPDSIVYGEINATAVSGENQTNVTNVGNVELNVSLEGYGFTQGDGNAMNCTLGATGNISVEHEKFNLTDSSPGTLSISQANGNYTNLTTIASIRDFNLTRRTNDTINKAIQETYWRIYVPTGAAGTCTGNIVFGATTADGA